MWKRKEPTIFYFFSLAIIHNSHFHRFYSNIVSIFVEMEKLKPWYLSQSCFNQVRIFVLCVFVDKSYLSLSTFNLFFRVKKKNNKKRATKQQQSKLSGRTSNSINILKMWWCLVMFYWKKSTFIIHFFLSITTDSDQGQRHTLTNYT